MKFKFSSDGIPGELIDAVLYHLNDDRVSLLACTLVSSSWCSFARCHLLHTVVCRPNVPHLLPRHLSTFLPSIPDVIPHIHSLKIIGSHTAESRSEVAVEDVMSLLSALPKLKSLSLERVPLFTRAPLHGPPIEATPLPGSEPLTINLCAISYTDSTDSFFRVLRDYLGLKPIRAFLRFAIHDDHSSFPAFLDIFGRKIIHLSCNLLGYLGDFSFLIADPESEDQLYEQNLDSHADAPPCTSVADLDLYLTGSGVADPDTQLIVLGGQILAIGELAKFLAPDAPIRRVTLRFQRFGPHTRATERMLSQILVPSNWFQFISSLERLLLQFRRLETLTCVLCDDGLAEQYGDYVPAVPMPTTVSSVAEVISREEEYAFYESFVRRAFPEFLAKGVLQIRRA
ncbi:hypothetical protein GSI_10749 [Ganoderma sinense ZZ0214-1]|uniref:F-box domain-containing protein n=1 Tax=Ganoderma sinense ZZ0214-1 TaxID=1077348 RepID=A0A2G8S208_9APHY|nr:hypothetical protein GSI_10749 [Ganoderma sinense ZZ0214-1]